MELLSQLVRLFWWYLRPLVKWFLRKTTRLCELQRICYGEPSGAERTLGVETSLEQSRSPELQGLVKRLGEEKAAEEDAVKRFIESAVTTIMRVKSIKPELHRQFVQSMSICLKQILGYRQLEHQVEKLRCEAYDEGNLEHEVQLLELWRLLQPDRQLDKRITKQWQEIGFQGDDPGTDFRGMGMLGLHNLIFFAREYGSAARHILSHSHHPKYGYSFAIVGINLTHMAYSLLRDRSLRSHVYNAAEGLPSIHIFHRFYSYLFIEFDKFWLECEPRDIMEFNRIRDIFQNNIRSQLEDPKTCFKVKIEIDTV